MAHPYVRVRVSPNGRPNTRFGFSVAKQVGNAVARNRLKRRLREVVRQVAVRQGYDVVVIGRPAGSQAAYADVRAAVVGLLARAHILEEQAQ